MAKGSRKGKNGAPAPQQVTDYRHETATRKNNPPAKIAAEGTVPVIPKAQYAYSPRLAPVLRFDPAGGPDSVPDLLAKATREPLTADEARLLAEALRTQEPWLEWANKAEQHRRGFFEVDPVALHIHERISAQAILKIAARQDVERTLFGDPEQEYHQAVQFYRHDIDWTNRLILGDSLQVMSSLARREDLAGKVQMIYIDPPYGIKFASNFQPEVGKRDVKDKDTDLTREPEMVKAYRDTWHLGIHSYLSYLRDRLMVAKDLLTDSGSIFVQISDENVHRVRSILDGVFGQDNSIVTILLKKKGGQKSGTIDPINDYLLWYAKDKTAFAPKFHRLFKVATLDSDYLRAFGLVELEDGQVASASQLSALDSRDYEEAPHELIRRYPGCKLFTSGDATIGGVRKNQSVLFQHDGQQFDPGLARGNCWKHTAVQTNAGLTGMERLSKSGRLHVGKGQVRIKRFSGDFGASAISNWCDEFGGAMDRVYVVQTNTRVIERCMLMCTEPGDLVIDPTCGSGTTAYVAEQWGRRWITIDTSRVAVAIARQRLMTARFERYRVKGEDTNGNGRAPERTGIDPHPGFMYKTVPHVTSSVVANCAALDPIFAKHEPILESCLTTCNKALAKLNPDLRHKLEAKLAKKERENGKKSITDADRRRWLLPPGNRDRSKSAKERSTVDLEFAGWHHWEVPFDVDPDWPKGLQDAVDEYRKAWRAKMDEVNACIAANAEQEELVDQPEIVRGVVRVSGPFTVEAVQPPEMSLGDNVDPHTGGNGKFDGEPEGLPDGFAPRTLRMVEPRGDLEVKNVEAYLEQMVRLLRTDGVRFPNNKQMAFTRLERLITSASGVHAEGRWVPVGAGGKPVAADDDPEGRATVAVAFGPQYGPVTAKMVEDCVRAANRMGYDDLVVAGFSFDGPAQAVIEEAAHPKLRIHPAHIRPDVNPGMEGLLKEQPNSQLFTVFGQPRTSVDGPDKDGMYTVAMEGVDIYNPVDNTIRSTGAEKVAAWFIDGDYDGWTFCITQAFFPDRTAWDKLSKALTGVVDPERFEALSGTVSLPFPAGKHKCVAVKVIDPRGNEVMRVHRL